MSEQTDHLAAAGSPAGTASSAEGPGAARRPSSNELVTQGWASSLASLVTAFLIVESLTGLWIYVAPFSVSSQVQVILHTVVGVVLIVPYLWYQVRHFLAWYRQSITAVMVLGYALGVMVLICVLSGVVHEILAEWQPSAHRFAAANPPFRKVQQNFAEDRDAAQTRYCAGCHDPISLFAGAKDIQNLELAALARQVKVAASDDGGCGFGELSGAAAELAKALTETGDWAAVEEAAHALGNLAHRVKVTSE